MCCVCVNVLTHQYQEKFVVRDTNLDFQIIELLRWWAMNNIVIILTLTIVEVVLIIVSSFYICAIKKTESSFSKQFRNHQENK